MLALHAVVVISIRLFVTGADWHASIRSDQNHCTSGDLPRFVRNFYEECRGPPQLFLLDKYVRNGTIIVILLLVCGECAIYVASSFMCSAVWLAFLLFNLFSCNGCVF